MKPRLRRWSKRSAASSSTTWATSAPTSRSGGRRARRSRWPTAVWRAARPSPAPMGEEPPRLHPVAHGAPLRGARVRAGGDRVRRVLARGLVHLPRQRPRGPGADRRHPAKRARALASGELPIAAALLLAPGLLLLAAGARHAPALAVRALLAAYVATSLAYSIVLKRLALVDVFVLAGLYLLRG